MLNASANPPEPFTIIEKLLAGMGQNPEAAMRQEQMSGDKTMETAERRKAIQQKNRQGIRDLNLAWMNQMIESPAQLREKMAFFWHGHFACRTQNSFFSQQLLNTIRTHALSDFGTLLAEVSKSAAMLQFLNKLSLILSLSYSLLHFQY